MNGKPAAHWGGEQGRDINPWRIIKYTIVFSFWD